MNNDEKNKKTFLPFFKKKDIVETPKDFFKYLDDCYKFDFDPCPINPTFDGLNVDWGKRNFINPPFSEISKWLKKGLEEQQKQKNILNIFLIPVRTNTKYWFNYVFQEAKEIHFIKKGIRFVGYNSPIPIPLSLVVFSEKKDEKERRREYLADGSFSRDKDGDSESHPERGFEEYYKNVPNDIYTFHTVYI